MCSQGRWILTARPEYLSLVQIRSPPQMGALTWGSTVQPELFHQAATVPPLPPPPLLHPSAITRGTRLTDPLVTTDLKTQVKITSHDISTCFHFPILGPAYFLPPHTPYRAGHLDCHSSHQNYLSFYDKYNLLGYWLIKTTNKSAILHSWLLSWIKHSNLKK